MAVGWWTAFATTWADWRVRTMVRSQCRVGDQSVGECRHSDRSECTPSATYWPAQPHQSPVLVEPCRPPQRPCCCYPRSNTVCGNRRMRAGPPPRCQNRQTDPRQRLSPKRLPQRLGLGQPQSPHQGAIRHLPQRWMLESQRIPSPHCQDTKRWDPLDTTAEPRDKNW